MFKKLNPLIFVTLPIAFSELTLKADLYAVDPRFMNTPIIIGTDILNPIGVMPNGRYLTYELRPKQYVMIATQAPVRTDLTGDDLQKLLALMNKFSTFFIDGIATENNFS